MNNTKTYITSILISIILISIITFFINLLSHFNLINNNIYQIITTISICLSIFTGGYYLGKKKEEKGYKAGTIYGILICLTFIIGSLISKQNLTISSLIYYIIIILIGIVSSIIGINKKKVE